MTLAVLLGAAAAAPGAARAEAVLLTVQAGALRLDEPREAVWRPAARIDLALRLVGPLRVGAFVSGAARTGALEDAGIGGGAFVMLRPEIPGTGLFPLVEGLAGHLTLPAASQGTEDVWTTGLGLGLGVHLGRGVSLEARVRHHWLHAVASSAGLDDRAWEVTGGLGFFL